MPRSSAILKTLQDAQSHFHEQSVPLSGRFRSRHAAFSSLWSDPNQARQLSETGCKPQGGRYMLLREGDILYSWGFKNHSQPTRLRLPCAEAFLNP